MTMTKTIDRYFIREFVPPFLFTIFSLTFILLMDQLFRLIDLIVRKGLPLDIVGLILIYTLPLIASYTAPMAILVAIVMSFGRLSQDNEILALKTCGVSFISVMKTPFVVVGLFMLFLIFFNNSVVPEANHRGRNLMLDVARKRPAVRLPEGVFSNEFPGYTVYIGRKDERTSRIFDVTVYDLRNNVIVTAPRGEIKNLDEEGIIKFILYDGELHQLVEENRYQKTSFGTDIINMKVDADLIRRERKARSEDELDVKTLTGKIAALNREIAALQKETDRIGREALEKYRNGDQSMLENVRFRIGQKITQWRAKIRERGRFEIELNKKFSLAFACLIFLIVGAPLGYLFRRGGIAGIIVGVLLFSLYYILVLSGEEFADRRNFSPFWAMWLPNLVILIPGLVMFWIAEFDRLPVMNLFRKASA
jgi:lipopolysaccharide export system permease protein